MHSIIQMALMESRSRSFDLRESINPQRQHRGAAHSVDSLSCWADSLQTSSFIVTDGLPFIRQHGALA